MRVLLRQTFSFCKDKNNSRIPYNINQQQHRSYLSKLQQAQQTLDSNTAASQLPRRKRRLYDRPRLDTNIQGYGAWRVYTHEENLYKPFEHSHRLLTKVQLQPKWLLHGFGIGCHPRFNRRNATKEFVFVDNKMSIFTLYDYRMTTRSKPNKEGYDYDNQEHIPFRQRITKRRTQEEFWSSEEYLPFWLNGSNYAEYPKFRKWIETEVEKRKSLKSYDEQIDQKFGKPITFNKSTDSQYFEAREPMILKIGPGHFSLKKGADLSLAEVELGKKMEDKFMIPLEERSHS